MIETFTASRLAWAMSVPVRSPLVVRVTPRRVTWSAGGLIVGGLLIESGPDGARVHRGQPKTWSN